MYRVNDRVIVSESRPARGGWIEMHIPLPPARTFQSRPARGGWIEIAKKRVVNGYQVSRPARGGWIEIFAIYFFTSFVAVPPRTGRVD